MHQSEKGFAMVLSLVLLLAMSLMGGALILISSNDHQSNNSSDRYQQTFYAAEMALLAGENYVLNEKTGPWSMSLKARDVSKKNLPAKHADKFEAKGSSAMATVNYNINDTYKFEILINGKTKTKDKKIANTQDKCFKSFPESNRSAFYVAKDSTGKMIAKSYNLGIFLENSIGKAAGRKSDNIDQLEATRLKSYFYEFFVERIGAASFKGFGQSIKKTASDASKSGIAYRVYACGIYIDTNKTGRVLDEMIVPLESIIVLPQN